MNDKKIVEFDKGNEMDMLLKSKVNRILQELHECEVNYKEQLTDTAKAQLIVARQAVSQAVNALR